MKRWYALVIALSGLVTAIPAWTQQQEPQQFSQQIEIEGRKVGQTLRCVVCQNQSIEDLAAPLAADMRRLVRERLAAGETPSQVRRFMTDRYGNFVLMKPPLQIDTLVLWFGPLLFIILAGLGTLAYLRRGQSGEGPPEPLSDEETARVNAIMGQGGEG